MSDSSDDSSSSSSRSSTPPRRHNKIVSERKFTPQKRSRSKSPSKFLSNKERQKSSGKSSERRENKTDGKRSKERKASPELVQGKGKNVFRLGSPFVPRRTPPPPRSRQRGSPSPYERGYNRDGRGRRPFRGRGRGGRGRGADMYRGRMTPPRRRSLDVEEDRRELNRFERQREEILLELQAAACERRNARRSGRHSSTDVSRSPSPKPKLSHRRLPPDQSSRRRQQQARSPSPRRRSISRGRDSLSPVRRTPPRRQRTTSPRRKSFSPIRRSPSPRRSHKHSNRRSPSPMTRSPSSMSSSPSPRRRSSRGERRYSEEKTKSKRSRSRSSRKKDQDYRGGDASSRYNQDVDYRMDGGSSSRAMSQTNGSQNSSVFHPQKDTLSNRFKQLQGIPLSTAPFEAEENIMIDIHRKFPAGQAVDDDLPVIFAVDTERFVFPRRPGEGDKPIFDRPEILSRRYDEEEHSARVIRVSSKKKRKISTGEKQNSKDVTTIKMSDIHLVRSQQERTRLKADVTSRRSASPKEVPRKKAKVKKRSKYISDSEDEKAKSKRTPPKGDLRNNLMRKRRIPDERDESRGSRTVQKRDDRDDYELKQKRAERENLPDFKLRPDREQIDKYDVDGAGDKYYFEHDNRMEYRGRGWRGRGRGGFRGSYRGRPQFDNGRGSRTFYRGRGRGSYDRSPNSWKHDKFDKN